MRWAMLVVTAVNVVAIAVLVAALAVPLPARGTDWSVAVEYRDGAPAYVFLSHDDKWRLPVALDEVDPRFVDALVALEDKRFFSHAGVDPVAIARAAVTDLIHVRRVSGGSTLTMQLARLLEPRPRTLAMRESPEFARYSREILEVFLARGVLKE